MSRGIFVRLEEPADSWAVRTLLSRFVINLAGLFLASVIVPGVHIGDWQALAAWSAIFAIVNMLLRPLATFASCCLIVATFGLSLLVINAALLAASAWVAGQLSLEFTIDGPWAAGFGALVISLVSMIATVLVRARAAALGRLRVHRPIGPRRRPGASACSARRSASPRNSPCEVRRGDPGPQARVEGALRGEACAGAGRGAAAQGAGGGRRGRPGERGVRAGDRRALRRRVHPEVHPQARGGRGLPRAGTGGGLGSGSRGGDARAGRPLALDRLHRRAGPRHRQAGARGRRRRGRRSGRRPRSTACACARSARAPQRK